MAIFRRVEFEAFCVQRRVAKLNWCEWLVGLIFLVLQIQSSHAFNNALAQAWFYQGLVRFKVSRGGDA